jgi:hypothetical protein
MARYHAHASLEGSHRGYPTARTELAESVPPHAVDGVLAAYRAEGYKLAARTRAVELVERAARSRSRSEGLRQHAAALSLPGRRQRT